MDNLVNLVVTARSEAECLNFLRLIYEGKEYTCDGLKKYVNENGLNFDTVLKEITIKYRGNSKKYLEYVDEFNEIGFKLPASELYLNKYSIDLRYYRDIQKALMINFVERIEDALSNAKIYIGQALWVLPDNYDENYVITYNKRTLSFENACMSLYSCYDYMLCLVYSYYKYEELIAGDKDLKKLLKEAKYSRVKKMLVEEIKDERALRILKILDDLLVKITQVRDWCNAVKHRGGIEYYGLKPKHLFGVEVSVHGKKVDTTNLFRLPVVDIDEEMESVMMAYVATYEAVQKIVIKLER